MTKVNGWQPPHIVPGTSRVKVITPDGKALEHQRIYMPAEGWAALRRIAIRQNLSFSQIIENLVTLADRVSGQGEKTRQITETPALLK